MEGLVGQRITKLSQAKASNFKTNFYNIECIKLIMNFGSTNGTYLENRCVNLSPGSCWTLVTDEDPGDVFSLSASGEVLIMEVSVGDVQETDTIRAVEEEHTLSEQNIEGAIAVKQSGEPEASIGPKEINEAAVPLHHQTVEDTSCG